MKVDIGPFPKWFGPYQFARLLKYVGVAPDTCDMIAEKYIPSAPFVWLQNLKGERKVKIHIDNYDAWGADHTFAMIAVPLLERVKASKKGVPGSMLSDEYNTLTASKEYWDEKAGGPLHVRADILFAEAEQKWDEILDHMIWSFREYMNEEWDEQFWTGEMGNITFKDNGDGTSTMETTGNRTCDWDARAKHWNKIQEGINLFAKHYSSLWT